MKTLSDNLYRRLNLSKYLFRQARRILYHSEPYARGLATSLLQDAVEVFLRVLIEQYRIEVPRRDNFLQLIANVSKRINRVGGHSASLKRLNTARVGFKHEGLDVTSSDVEAFMANAEAFLSEICMQELGIDFTTLSLIETLGHRRTQNWLEKAREALGSEDYTNSIGFSAAAVAIYLHHRDTHRGELVSPSHFIDTGPGELGAVADWVLDYVEPIRTRVDLVSHGIDVPSFERFDALTPHTHIGSRGEVRQHELRKKSERSSEDARFCYDFAVDSLLALREVDIPAGSQPDIKRARGRVIARCELMVHPDTDPPEVIRVAQPDEELVIAPRQFSGLFSPDESEFAAILQDDDVAYVRRDCLENGFDLAT